MASGIRCVVTGQIDGRGRIAQDGPAPEVDMGEGGKVYEIWRAPHPTGVEPEGVAWDVSPPNKGSVFRIAEFPPHYASDAPWMHLTQTIDYGCIIEGELTLVMDGEETILRPGDVFVQRAANHGWANRSDRRCRMAVILIDGAQ
ncbi:MAG: cupin domain-containing protein [Caulobacterales bacterium]